MLGADDRHLTESELEFLSGQGDTSESAGVRSDAQSKQLADHLPKCSECAARLSKYTAARHRLAMLKTSSNTSKGNLCPADERWTNLAAGITDSVEAEELITHAIDCDRCSTRLREAEAVFSDLVSREETSTIAGLQSSKESWQQQLASRLSSQQIDRRAKRRFAVEPRRLSIMLWVSGAVTALILVAVGWWFLNLNSETRAQSLIAEAYSGQRTVEMRIPGANHAPISRKRGSTGSGLSRPVALLEAELLISKNLRLQPNNPQWLIAKGRVELLEWQYSDAIESLERARQLEPGSSWSVLSDLAIAYFERGQSEDQPKDFAKSLDFLTNALKQNPGSSLLLFNRAIVEESLHLYDDALVDWDHFQRVEPAGAWVEEARTRRSGVIEKLKPRSQWDALPERDPDKASIVLGLRLHAMTGESSWPDSLDEAYLDVAIMDWLPNLARVQERASLKPLVSSERAALHALATVLLRFHDDSWLEEFLRDSSSAAWRKGVQALADAFKSNRQGDPDRARQSARMAEILFRSSGNEAGRLRAELETVMALKKAQKGPRCLVQGVLLNKELQGKVYSWIEISNLLEMSSCYGLTGDAGKAKEFAGRTMRLSGQYAFGYLHLRSLCWEDGVGIDAPESLLPEAWSKVGAGLAEFWRSPHPPLPALEFYEDLGFLAEGAEYWDAAEAIGRETVIMSERTGDRAYEGAAHHWLAQMARMADDPSLADAEFEAATNSFRSLAPSQAVKMNWVTLELERVSLETNLGQFEKAKSRLQQLRIEIAHISDFLGATLYYQTEGELYLREGDFKAAEKALKAAIHINEVGLNSLSRESDAARLAWDEQGAHAYRDLVELYLRSDAEKALDIWEWYRVACLRKPHGGSGQRHFDFVALDKGPLLPAIPRAKSLRPAGMTVLSFAVFPSGIASWVLNDKGIYGSWVSVPRQKVQSESRNFKSLCANPQSDMSLLKAPARELYSLLISPIRRHIPNGAPLTVELDDALDEIPIQALISPEGNYFAGEFAITIGPGLGYLGSMHADKFFSGKEQALIISSAAVGGALSSEFPPLPEADEEAFGVATRLKAARLVTGKLATASLLKKELSGAEIVHFAGHAVSQKEGAGLLLSTGGVGTNGDLSLNLFDATQLRPFELPRTRLVVLSACGTANSENGFESSRNLVYAFLKSGVPHVLASRWQVDSEITAETVDEFYSSLLVGKSVAASLQAAQENIRNHSSTGHPYYWAPFAAFGR